MLNVDSLGSTERRKRLTPATTQSLHFACLPASHRIHTYTTAILYYSRLLFGPPISNGHRSLDLVAEAFSFHCISFLLCRLSSLLLRPGLYLPSFSRGVRVLGPSRLAGPKTVPDQGRPSHVGKGASQPDNVVLHWFTMTQCCIETISNRQEGSSGELKLTPLLFLNTMQGVSHFSQRVKSSQPPPYTALASAYLIINYRTGLRESNINHIMSDTGIKSAVWTTFASSFCM